MAWYLLSKFDRAAVKRFEKPCFWSRAMARWMAWSLMTYPWARYSAKMRERGLSSCARPFPACSSLGVSSDVVAAVAADFSPAISPMDWAADTWTELGPNWVLSRRRAVFAALLKWLAWDLWQ